MISCGAALQHAQTVFASLHWRTDVERIPDPTQPDLLATIDFSPWRDPPTAVLRRAEAIEYRYTDRLPMAAPSGWASIRLALEELVSRHGLTLDILDEDARTRLSLASEQSEALRRYDMEYQSEIRWWSGHSHLAEGVPASALVSEPEAARVGVVRDFPHPKIPARRGELRDHARLAVLTATDEMPQTWLRTGEALSAALLECTASGLSTCALTHITELTAGRRLLGSLIGHPGIPQVVLRIGLAPDDRRPPPTPRRPVPDVLGWSR